MIQEILKLDRALFKLINQTWSNGCFDWLMPILREAKTWIPLYVGLIAYGIWKYKKWSILWIIIGAAAVGLSDKLGMLVKYQFHRVRPVNDPEMNIYIRKIIGYWPQSFSFVSNHAMNHFTIAVFVLCTASFPKPWLRWLFILWPVLVCYAQLYVGVHYPLDVLGGALLGILLGFGAAKLFNFIYRKPPAPKGELFEVSTLASK